ncbi:hypothetical protein JL721_12296 [Aureococcus anophagefferens]|nr:hypothetical protein JL721_12296 [Aureococcus anophagefferens]
MRALRVVHDGRALGLRDRRVAVDADDETYEERLAALSPISTPLADEKLTKKLHKLVKKASSAKALRRGVKEVVKAIRKGATGLCIIAGDISPIDVICHLPIFCEEKSVPYIYAGATFEHQDLLDKAISLVGKDSD